MIPEAVDYEMRGGMNPIPELDDLEKEIAEKAFQATLINPAFAKKGYRWAYNYIYFHTIWESRDPRIINLWYKYEPYPEFIEIEATQKCHLKCIQCEHTYWDELGTDMTFKQFKYIIDQFPNLKWSSPNGLGDPFLNPEFWKFLEYGKEKGFLGEIYSNTSLLNRQDMKRFVKKDLLTYFRFSIDAATKKTYEAERIGINWDKVIDNLIALDHYKKKFNNPFPKIWIHYLVTRQTIDEAMQMLDFLHELKIDIDGIMYSRLLHYFPEIKNLFMEVPRNLFQQLQAKGKELNIQVAFNEDAPEFKPPANECLAWQMPYIFPDGTVISCCCMNEQNRRWWQRKTAMGNIFQKPFREIWNDKPYKRMRAFLKAGKIKQAHPVCAICNIYNIDVSK